MDILSVNGVEYQSVRLLGKGKGGYSYLVRREGREYVLKQIHHEPCAYYSFGDKIAAEENDYGRLLRAGIRIPEMYAVDRERERIIKQYIDGPTMYEKAKRGEVAPYLLEQVREMARQAREAGLNIDYFPTNFIEQGGLLYYVDYECNPYMDEWSFENWGVKYWYRSREFLEHWAREVFAGLEREYPGAEWDFFGGHFYRDEKGGFAEDTQDIPVISLPGLCDIELGRRGIDVSAKLTRETALEFDYSVFGGDFEAYGVEDWLSDYYHTGASIETLRENIVRSSEREVFFSFRVEQEKLPEFVKKIKALGFYY